MELSSRPPAAVSSERAPAPSTLAIDIGGTGIKAAVLDSNGRMATARARVVTTYPMAPEHLIDTVVDLVGAFDARGGAPAPASYHRVSVGFPGVIRDGHVLTAPHFVTTEGPGTSIDAALADAWSGFDLAEALGTRLGRPIRVANDADLQGGAVVSGQGLELVVTLGTGVGTGLYWQGRLAPHLELAHHPLAKGQTYDERLGEAARLRAGNKKWRRRVVRAIDVLYSLLHYDHLFIGGGNSSRLRGHVPDGVTLVDNAAGILGGIKLWEQGEPPAAGATRPGPPEPAPGRGARSSPAPGR